MTSIRPFALRALLAIPIAVASAFGAPVGASPSVATIPATACTIAAPPATFAYDASAPLRVVRSATRSSGIIAEADIRFRSGTQTIGATLVHPRVRAAEPAPAILFVHWLGDPATTNRTEFLPDARALAARGISSLLVDAEWSAKNWFAIRTPASDACDTIAQVVALRRALDVLIAQTHPDPARIALVGHDFGAMTGALVTAVDTRPRFGVFMTPTLTFWEWFLLGTPPADPAAYTQTMSVFDLPRWLPRAHLDASLLQFAKRDVYVSSATASALRNVMPARGRTLKRYDADHALTVAAATADRRAWLLAHLIP